MDTLHIWTDGSYNEKYAVGGWGVVLKPQYADWHLELNGQVDCDNANYAEMYAVLSAICLIDSPAVLKIHSDSHAARIAIRGRYLKEPNLYDLSKAIAYKVKNYVISVEVARPTVGYGYLRRCHDLSRMATRARYVDLELRRIQEFKSWRGHTPLVESP